MPDEAAMLQKVADIYQKANRQRDDDIKDRMTAMTNAVEKMANSIHKLTIDHADFKGVLNRAFDRVERLEDDVKGLLEIKDKVSKNSMIRYIVLHSIYAMITGGVIVGVWLIKVN